MYSKLKERFDESRDKIMEELDRQYDDDEISMEEYLEKMEQAQSFDDFLGEMIDRSDRD